MATSIVYRLRTSNPPSRACRPMAMLATLAPNALALILILSQVLYHIDISNLTSKVIMDYSQFKVLEFRRKFFKILGASISIFDPNGNKLVGYIKMKAFKWRGDIRVYSDTSMQREIVHIGGKQIVSFKPSYEVTDSATNTPLVILRFRGLKTYFLRGHIDILDMSGNQYGYVQETSSQLAIIRRYFGIIPYVGVLLELILAFVPQTFDIMYAPAGAAPQLAGSIVHRKNPLVVKMSLNTTAAQISLDARINIAICSLLSILDANKNA